MNQKTKNKLLLITTEGCEGCSILNKLVLDSLELLETNIEYTVKDVSEVPKKLIRAELITDFPTLLFYKDDEIIHKIVGTTTKYKLVLLLTRNFD